MTFMQKITFIEFIKENKLHSNYIKWLALKRAFSCPPWTNPVG